MVLLGTIVNCLLILTGSLFGRWLQRIPERFKKTVMHGIALAVIILGIDMGLETGSFLVVILSLVFGAILGEWMDLEGKLNQFGKWIERLVGKGGNHGNISEGFVTATLIFTVGAMAIIGALNSGIRGDHSVLYIKGILDGFTSLILTTTLGIGVLFSAVPVFIYQGLIAIFATYIDQLVPQAFMDQFIIEMTATGGIMIVAIGLNMLGLTKVRVANLLPALVVVALLIPLLDMLPIDL